MSMQISTRILILFGVISLFLAAGVVCVMNQNAQIEPLLLPAPDDAVRDTQTAINT